MGISRSSDYLARQIQRKIRRMIEVESFQPSVTVVPGGRIVPLSPIPDFPTLTPAILTGGTESGDAVVVGPGPGFVAAFTPQYADILILVNAGGAIITPAEVKLDLPIDIDCVIVSWTMFSDLATTARFDIWSDTYANFPPVLADTMPGADANKPKLVAATKASGGVVGWTKTVIAAGDILRINLDTNDLSKRLSMALKVRRT